MSRRHNKHFKKWQKADLKALWYEVKKKQETVFLAGGGHLHVSDARVGPVGYLMTTNLEQKACLPGCRSWGRIWLQYHHLVVGVNSEGPIKWQL